MVKREGNSNTILFRAISTCLFLWICIQIVNPLVVYADNGNTIVHITKTGVCYHAEGCKHLRQSDYPVTLYYAVIENGFNECEDCKDRLPVYDGPEPLHPKMTKRDVYPSSGNKKATPTPTPTKKPEVKPKEESSNALPFLILGGIFGVPVLLTIKSSMDDSKERRIKKEQYEQERQKYFELYGNKHSYELVDIPQGSFIQGGYPCTNNKKKGKYGDYTVYVGKKRMGVLHFNPHCGGADLTPTNYYLARNLRHCKRCAMGKVNLPSIDWYIKYVEIEKIKNKYNIP